jgi:hypothetical protein
VKLHVNEKRLRELGETAIAVNAVAAHGTPDQVEAIRAFMSERVRECFGPPVYLAVVDRWTWKGTLSHEDEDKDIAGALGRFSDREMERLMTWLAGLPLIGDVILLENTVGRNMTLLRTRAAA